MDSFLLAGDMHVNRPLSRQVHYVTGRIGESYKGHLEAAKYANRTRSTFVCAGDLTTDRPEDIAPVITIAEKPVKGFYNAIGNWDWDRNIVSPQTTSVYINEITKQSLNIFPWGHRGEGSPWYDVLVGDTRLIFLHNIQDLLYDGVNRAYPYVNLPGGMDELDWGGISVPTSPQRNFLRATLSDVASRGQHVIIIGHRPVYGLVDWNYRPNHIEAMNEEMENGYPKGYIREIEDWCMDNQQHVLFLSGDQHAFAMTKPMYRNETTNSNGIIHLNMTSGPFPREGALLDEDIHVGWARYGHNEIRHYENTSFMVSYLDHNFPADLSWLDNHDGIQFYMLCMYEDNRMRLLLLMSIYGNFRSAGGPDSVYRLDEYEIPIVNNKLTGTVSRIYA